MGDYLWQFCCAPGFALSPLYWVPVSVLLVLFWISLGRGKGLREFLNWDGAIRHKSTKTDPWLFLIGRVMAVFGIVSSFTFGPAVARFVADVSPLPPLFANGLSPFGLTVAVFVLFDFAQYWSHRIFHRTALWNLHAVHHSAEVLTPLTTCRVHPLAGLIMAAFHSVVLGVGMGLAVGPCRRTWALSRMPGLSVGLAEPETIDVSLSPFPALTRIASLLGKAGYGPVAQLVRAGRS